MMNKTALASAFALMLASSFTQAEEAAKKFYVGFNFGFGSGEETADIDGDEYDEDMDISTTRLSAGLVVDKRIRLEASYNTYDFDFDDSGDSDVTIFEFDGVLLFPANEISPYLTAGLGLATYEDTGEFLEGGDDLQGISFQIGGGIIFAPADNVELDASYRIKAIGWQTVEIEDSYSDLELSDSMGVISLGARVLF